MIPNGNGYYIWLLERAAGGDPKKLAEMCRDAGLKWVAIKVADGCYPVNFSTSTLKPKVDLVGPAVDAFREVGIAVFGWHYVYGSYPDQEAVAGANRVRQFGLDGYIIDAEVEYKNKPTQAKTYVKALRNLLKVPIGLSSFRFPTYHPEFPWNYMLNVDFHVPQVYWMGATNAGAQLQRSYYEFKKMKPGLPFIPAGAAFSEHGWSPTVAQITEFRQVAADLKLPGACWWEIWDATVRHPDWWKASTGTIDLPKKPTPTAKHVMTKYYDLRIRNAPSLTGAIVGYMAANKVYTIVQEQGVWGRIDGAIEQWVHLGYCVTVV